MSEHNISIVQEQIRHAGSRQAAEAIRDQFIRDNPVNEGFDRPRYSSDRGPDGSRIVLEPSPGEQFISGVRRNINTLIDEVFPIS